MNELRSVQQSCRRLRPQVESITSNADASDIVARQDALLRGLERVEDSMSTFVQDQDRVAETNREYQAKADLCLAHVERVNQQNPHSGMVP